ncbi:MAG: hypothetical protein R3261_01360 [Alphaproteobacteria bacterium]|nr:hypothetical protein [Alphaproteobacteria bacterium]
MINFPIEYSEVAQLYRQTISQGLKVIAIASMESGEGTTLLARTLAERSASTGQKTLLVDINIANPQLDQIYSISRQDWHPGDLSNLPVQKTGVENLHVLASPTTNASRWEFRDLGHLSKLIETLRGEFDQVIFDTSPLGRCNQWNIPSDGLCSCTDGTLLCVLTGVTSENKIRDAVALLKTVNARLHGAVLNDRYAPSLLAELIRETARLERLFPRISAKLRKLLRNSTLLNVDI